MANATLSKDEILEAIGNMSVIELAELIDAFKTKFNVTVVAASAAPAGGAATCALSMASRAGHARPVPVTALTPSIRQSPESPPTKLTNRLFIGATRCQKPDHRRRGRV